MLLPKNINPSYSIYYYGSIVLEALINSKADSADFLQLYQDVNSTKRISLQSFILTLDWLFLLGSINMGKGGKIKKCF